MVLKFQVSSQAITHEILHVLKKMAHWLICLILQGNPFILLKEHIQGDKNCTFSLGLASIDCQQEVSTPFQVEGLTNSEAYEWCVATGNGVLSDGDNVLSGDFLGSVQTQQTTKSSSFYWIGSSNQSSRSFRLFPTDQRSKWLRRVIRRTAIPSMLVYFNFRIFIEFFIHEVKKTFKFWVSVPYLYNNYQ